MNGIIEKRLCTGCRACEWNCPVGCITMWVDREGFLYPKVDEKKCIQCGKCRDVCVGNKHRQDSHDFQKLAFAAWNKDSKIRHKSSSGGIFYSLAKNMITTGGTVYGAAFDDDFMVRHRRITDMEGFSALMGSKYVQSDTAGTYKQVLEDLKSGYAVLYSGTPCQISALLEFTKGYEEKLFTASLICHGTPSPDVWKKYLDLKKGQYAENTVRNISFRDKSYGWKDFSIFIEFERHCYLKSHRNDLYMQGFLQNLFLRPSCYQCNAKGFSAGADLVMGDFWGAENEIPEIDINSGMSCLIVCTPKGLDLWDGIKNYIQFREVSSEAIYRNNSTFWHSVPQNENRKSFFDDLAENGLLEKVMKKYIRPIMNPNDDEKEVDGAVVKKIDTIGFHLYDKWLRNLRNGKNIDCFFHDNLYRSIAIYGMGFIGIQIFEELKTSDIQVYYGIDQNAQEKNIEGLDLITPDLLKNTIQRVDAVVVTPIQYFYEIENLLLKSVSDIDIISIEQIVEYVFRHG